MSIETLEIRAYGDDWVLLYNWNTSVSFDSWDREITPGTGNPDDGDLQYDQYGELGNTGIDAVCVFNGFDIADAKKVFDTIYTQYEDVDNGRLELRYCPQGKDTGNRCVFTTEDARVDSITMQCVNRSNKMFIALNFHVTTSGFDVSDYG